MNLANRYRPKDFDSIIGQDFTVKMLQNQLLRGNIKSALGFFGPTGTGKTTTARCFGNAINGGTGEIIELDCASQNSVENIRNIVEQANQRSLIGEYKVFILDEIHQLSSSAWNAFLKCLEEPPKYSIFIMCSTNPEKVPATILNRIQCYNLAKIPAALIKERLLYVCANEGFTNYEDTCELISHIAQGGLRDALTYLDQCVDYSTDLSLANAKIVLGDFSYETMLKLTNSLIDGNEMGMLSLIDSIYNDGRDLKAFIANYLEFAIDVVKYIFTKDITKTNLPAYLETSADNTTNLKYTVGIDQAAKWFNGLTNLLLDIKESIRNDTSYKTTIEAKLIKLCRN